jgi:hypothetical protein
MQATLRYLSMSAAALLALGACSPEKDEIVGPGGSDSDPTFANVKAALTAACGSCHGAASGRTFLVTMDSAALAASGLVNPASPATSAILSKPRSAAHGGGVVAALSTTDSALVAAWISLLPNVSATTLTAVRTDFAPSIDGMGEALWVQATPLSVPIGGGWAAATSVTARAMYDDQYLYMYFRWHDARASYRRQPWIKNADGTWSVAPAKPAPADGTDWAAYMAAHGGAAFDREAPEFMYEDKFAVMWNTYGAGTVPAFEQSGCAAVCHNPGSNGSPGTTYSANGTVAAKKYTSVPGQVLDMWHWKMVRHNMNSVIDDQVVRYWQPVNDATAANGGRGSDPGNQGYASNPALNGRPMYRSATGGILPSIYSWAVGDTVRMTDAEVAALPVGTQVANMMTSPVTGSRADIQGRAVYDPVAQVWTMELRRLLVTADAANDVQFNDLTRTYKWSVAVFDNAQIEHSYAGVPYSLIFKR